MQPGVIVLAPACYQNSQALVNSRVTSSLPGSGRLPILRCPPLAAARLQGPKNVLRLETIRLRRT